MLRRARQTQRTDPPFPTTTHFRANTGKQGREGGGWFAIWLIRGIGRYGGRALARLFLYPLTAYFLLRRTDERRDSRASLTRILRRPATLRDVAPPLHTFAPTILDRVFLPGGENERFAGTVQLVPHGPPPLQPGPGLLPCRTEQG